MDMGQDLQHWRPYIWERTTLYFTAWGCPILRRLVFLPIPIAKFLVSRLTIPLWRPVVADFEKVWDSAGMGAGVYNLGVVQYCTAWTRFYPPACIPAFAMQYVYCWGVLHPRTHIGTIHSSQSCDSLLWESCRQSWSLTRASPSPSCQIQWLAPHRGLALWSPIGLLEGLNRRKR